MEDSSVAAYSVPLSEYIRPKNLDEYIGQRHLVDPIQGQISGFLRLGYLPSMILAGPPGVGKTTLAAIVAASANYVFIEISATDTTVAQLKELLKCVSEENKKRVSCPDLPGSRLRVAAFIDEIHRFLKIQQDFLLPYVESGDFVFIGATTVEPHRRIRKAILSRCQVFCLTILDEQDSLRILKRAILYENIRRKQHKGLCFLSYSEKSVKEIVEFAQGDMRRGINFIELLSTRYERSENRVTVQGGLLQLDNFEITLTLVSLFRTCLGLKNKANLPKVHQLLCCISGESVHKELENMGLKPQVNIQKSANLFLISFKLSPILLSLMEMEIVEACPNLNLKYTQKEEEWINQMYVSDDSDENLTSLEPIVHYEGKSQWDRFRLFSAIYTMVNLTEKGESVQLIMKYLILYACLFTSGNDGELAAMVSAVDTISRASVDPLRLLSDCIERLCFARKERSLLKKQIDEIRFFLKLEQPRQVEQFNQRTFEIVFDKELESALLQQTELTMPKKLGLENLFNVELIDSTIDEYPHGIESFI